MLVTKDISPKAILAFLFPFLSTLAAVAGSWIVTGELNMSEIRVALAGLIASGIALLGAYVGKPGEVVQEYKTLHVRDEAGVTLVEVGVACGIVALAVVVLALADVVKL